MSGITPTIPTDLLTRCPPHTRWVDPVPKNLRSLRTKLMALDPTASGQERWVQVFFHLDPFEQVLTYATKHGQPLGTRPSLRCAETKDVSGTDVCIGVSGFDACGALLVLYRDRDLSYSARPDPVQTAREPTRRERCLSCER
eukprot:3933238-Rhodomonas_salina.5